MTSTIEDTEPEILPPDFNVALEKVRGVWLLVLRGALRAGEAGYVYEEVEIGSLSAIQAAFLKLAAVAWERYRAADVTTKGERSP